MFFFVVLMSLFVPNTFRSGLKYSNFRYFLNLVSSGSISDSVETPCFYLFCGTYRNFIVFFGSLGQTSSIEFFFFFWLILSCLFRLPEYLGSQQYFAQPVQVVR